MISKKYNINPISVEFNRIFLLIAALGLIVLRIVSDSFIYLVSDINSSLSIIWKFLTFLAIGACFFIYIFSKEEQPSEILEDSSSLLFFKLLKQNLYFLLILTILSFAQMTFFFEGEHPRNLFFLILIELSSIYATYVVVNILYFLFSGFYLRPHKKTKTYLKVLAFGLIYVFGVELIFRILNIKYNLINDIINIALLITLSIITLLNTKKNNWIISLSRSQKYRVFWLSLLGIILSLSLSINSLTATGVLYKSFYIFVSGFREFVGVSFFYLSFYLIRICIFAFTSLPTSSIVERKISELSSLTYLNRLISEAIEIDKLVETVTKLALGAGEASVAWTEFYGENQEIIVKSSQFISPEQIQIIHKNTHILEFFLNLKKSTLIESVPESEELFYLSQIFGGANSLIAVPLFESDKRIGTLVIIHPDEYGFEPSDLKVLSAYGDNVGIALENNRLLNSAIEKEHYKRELILAQRIQKKLLPQELPVLDNYSLAAMSFPSEEVGGDYYDAVFMKDGKLCILIGDVSGKGITAAFYMAQLKGVVLSIANEALGAADILKRINSTLYGSMEKQMYITISSIVLDSSSGNISIARAGHMPTLIKKNGIVKVLTPNGIGIGLVNSKIFDKIIEEQYETLSRGDMCLLFTDGVNEHRNDKYDELGYEPLVQICSKQATIDSGLLLQDVYNKILDFANGTKQHDDMTIVSLIYHGNNGMVFD